MRILYLALLLFSCLSVQAMENQATQLTNLARKHVEDSFKADGNASLQCLRKANLCAQRALQDNPNGLTAELAVITSFVKSVHALKKDDHDEALSCCYDVISGAVNTPFVNRLKQESWGLVQNLADDKKHAISQFFLIKHLLRSTKPANVQEGLKRFDALHMTKPSAPGLPLGKIFAESEVLVDLKKLADVDTNPHAQCILAEIHLFQAERGKYLDGAQVEPQEELQKALTYAQLSQQGNYEHAHALIELVRALQKEICKEKKSNPVEDVADQVEKAVSVDLTGLLPSTAVLQPIPPLKVITSLQLYKNILHNDHRALYEYGKKLLNDPNDQLWLIGMDYLKRSVQLGNAFAAERLGDELRELQPEQAAAHYYKAHYLFTHAPSGSYWRDAGCFRRRHLEWKLGVLSEMNKNVDAYQLACEHGNAAAVQQSIFGNHIKSHVNELASCVHVLETEYAQKKNTVETCVLEALCTSGTLRFMDLFKEDTAIQNVLINALSLRAHLGRGFVLEEPTSLAHYKKALHFILAPKEAAKQSLNASVPDALFLTQIKIDSFPVQHRILYLEGMLGVCEQLCKDSKNMSAKKARYVCDLFARVTNAITKTKDTHLRALHQKKYDDLLEIMYHKALIAQSAERMLHVGTCCMRVAEKEDVLCDTHWVQADTLLTRAFKLGHIKTSRQEETKKQLSWVRAIRARLAFIKGDSQEAQELYQQAVDLYPDNTEATWQLAQLLVDGGQIELRKKGLTLIEKLANRCYHREAQEYMVEAYCNYKIHLIEKDPQKAIPYLEQLIKKDGPEDSVHRVKLAMIYHDQAIEVGGTARKKLFEKARQAIRCVKDKSDAAHLLHLAILYNTDRKQEAVKELCNYEPSTSSSDQELFDLGRSYFKMITEGRSHLDRTLYEKAEGLFKRTQDTLDDGYLLHLTVLFDQRKYDQLEKALAIKKEPYLDCIKESFRAQSLLMQPHKVREFSQIITCFERAFDLFEQQFGSSAAQDCQDLVDLIVSLGASESVSFTHPMKRATLSHLTRTAELLSHIISIGQCTDEDRLCLLAHNGYFNAKLCLWQLDEIDQYATVCKLLATAVDAANKGVDLVCKAKIMQLMCGQVRFLLGPCLLGTFAQRVKKVSSLMGLCHRLHTGKEVFLCRPFYDVVVYADQVLHDFDSSNCTKEDTVTLDIQRQIIARIKSNLSTE